MKFGRQFEHYKIPEWFEYYYDYKGIKYVLNLLDIRPKKRKKVKALLLLKNYFRRYSANPCRLLRNGEKINLDSESLNSSVKLVLKNKQTKDMIIKRNRILDAEDLSIYPNQQKLSRFVQIYREKAKFVDDFFSKKLADYYSELAKLESTYDVMNVIKNPNNDENIAEEINAERDVMGYAVSWKRALSNLYNETSWLHGYHSINSLAIEKIKKKAKKVFKLYGIEIEELLENVNSEFPFFSSSVQNLFNLRMKIQQLYSDKFTKGNVKIGHKELERRLEGVKENKRYIFCLYIGVILSFIFFYIIVKVLDGKNTNDSFKPFFPFFSFSYIMILVLAFVGFGIAILRHFRLNYAYLFELDIEKQIDLFNVFQHVLGLTALWIILFLLTKLALKFELFGKEYTLFPLIMNTIWIIILFLPFHILYLSLRRGILTTLIRNMFPFGSKTVRFKDFVLGNILTSLSDSFKNLFLGYCLMVCPECYAKNSRGPCNKNSIPCLIVGIYPLFIRITQCFNKFYYSGLIWPHFFGLLKVLIAFGNNLSGFFYNRVDNHIRLCFRISFASVSTIYNLFWDYYLDWGLLQPNKKYFLLREKIAYPQTFYYIAMIFDIITSTMWTWNFIHIKSSLNEWKNILTCTLDVVKRFIWVLIRVENEILANPEGYRTILAIPELPYS
jgi:hypothetical protein